MRTRLALVLTTMWYLGFISGIHAATVIRFDPGGHIGEYARKLAGEQRRGERIVLDGDCLSACTLRLAADAPRNHMCATPRARFGFHAAWDPSPSGPVYSAGGTHLLMIFYREDVREMILSRGGLSTEMFFVPATDFVPPCPATPHTEARAQGRHPARKGALSRANARAR